MNTPWSRLQALSCEHATRIYQERKKKKRKYSPYCRTGTSVPEQITENCEILGRGAEEEIKARVLYYLDLHPEIFSAVSKRGWTLPQV